MGALMANRTNQERERLIDNCIPFYLQGNSSPYRLLKAVPGIKHYATAQNYLELARKRILDFCNQTTREDLFRRELMSLDFLEATLFEDTQKAKNLSEKTGLFNTILKVKERRAELLAFKEMGECFITNFSDVKEGLSEKDLDDEIQTSLEKLEKILDRTRENKKLSTESELVNGKDN